MKKLLFIVLAVSVSFAVAAKIKLPSIIGSNMVLQRNDTVALWGNAIPGAKVKINTGWDGKNYTVKAGSDGRWKLQVMTGDAGGPYKIVFSDGEETVLDNILLGEVWICGGQSNMEMPVCGDATQPAEGSYEALRTVKDYPDIRMFTVPRADTDVPLDSCGGIWHVSTPKNVSRFSAVAYYFGRTLSDFINVPVGLIASSYGGSSIEAWMTEDCIKSIDGVNIEVAYSGRLPREKPQRLWNAMLCPIKPFTARGFIWYQGEANLDRWFDYAKMQKAMIALWRKAWNKADMPFYITQIAPFAYGGDPENLRLPLLIEAQWQAANETPHCAVASTTDVGNRDCIHPGKKRQVGERLAWLALANDYGVEGLPAPAPTLYKMERHGENELLLIFKNVDAVDSFVYYDENGTLDIGGFEIAGDNQVFYPAKVKKNVWSNKIYLSSPQVPDPVAVRYAFRNYDAKANLHTNYGQPVPPFRTDTWQVLK